MVSDFLAKKLAKTLLKATKSYRQARLTFRHSHISRKFACSTCDKRFPSIYILKWHEVVHTAEKPFEKFACSTCDKRFPSIYILKRHEVVHTAEKPFECSECHRRFTQKASLQRHSSYSHNDKGQQFQCPKCGISFAQKYNLQTHLKRSHPLKVSDASKTYPCSECSCLFQAKNTLTIHKTKYHNKNANNEEGIDSEDPMQLVQSTLLQLKNLQNIQQLRSGDIKAATEEAQSRVEIVEVDVPSCDIVELNDRLNPQHAIKIIKAQRIRRDNGMQYYVCEFCSKEFKHCYHFIRHRRKHTKERPYKCSLCVQHFKTITELHRHQPQHRLDSQLGIISRQHNCSVCNENFPSMQQLDKHVKSSHSATHTLAYVCGICCVRFSTKTALSVHKHTVEDKELKALSRLIAQPIDLKLSKENAHAEGTLEQPTEAVKAATAAVKKTHNKTNNNEINFKCSTCLRTQTSLNTHQKLHHADVHMSYNCVHCFGKKFSTRHELRRHLLSHASSRNYKCAYCVKTFKTKDHCRSHMKTHIKMLLGENNGAAEIRTTETAASSQAKNHLVIVKEIGANVAVLPKSIELQMLPKCQQHKRRNFSIKTYETTDKETAVEVVDKCTCPHCGKSFCNIADLRRHLDIHAAVRKRPFTCQNCQKSFSLKSTLKEHELTHKAERNKHICIVCGNFYASKKVLTVHFRLHTGERPLKCSHCDQTFRTSGQRKAHEKQHNSEK